MSERAPDGFGEHQPVKGPRKKKGLLIVNTGNGKGKTTAAFGMALRAWGRGMRVAVYQFIKPPTANFGEHRAAKRIGLPVHPLGDGFTWKSKDPERTRALAIEQWGRACRAMFSGELDVLVLDEFTYVLHYGWLPASEVLAALADRPPLLHVVITGRYAPAELVAAADLVTEMTLVKHPYREQGIKAQPGVEF
ncbi:cob(I)yrinic acid a,c-diamide adenosyltransferase [Tepidiforma sp.]|uniref:cob(I)yrinic acid a,c-diamide adenosyltransferase n=1 Tax=Tepidiforma sp. TaxID=2682230 RepID=UPI002ADD943B|nr:cob(I)yrinic acid a,c-diamide adenosyltransferase [Tepidiforma sp.]